MVFENNFYVYVDWTLEDQPRAFYVGYGGKNRVARKTRNKHHTNIAKKYRSKFSKAVTGKKRSKKTKRLISLALKKSWDKKTPEERSISGKRRYSSMLERKKASKRMRLLWKNPEYRKCRTKIYRKKIK